MADKTTVEVNKMGVKESFDKKYQSSLPKVMTESFEKAIDKSGKLTTKPPKDKKAETLSLDGNLSLKKGKKGIDASISIVMAKQRAIFGTATSKASIELDDPEKVTDRDVNDLIEALLADVQPDVIKELEKKANQAHAEVGAMAKLGELLKSLPPPGKVPGAAPAAPGAADAPLAKIIGPAAQVKADGSPPAAPNTAPTTPAQGKDLLKKLQQSLLDAGFNPGKIDGIMGPNTKGAIKKFQQARGLKGDANLNPETIAALKGGAPPAAPPASPPGTPPAGQSSGDAGDQQQSESPDEDHQSTPAVASKAPAKAKSIEDLVKQKVKEKKAAGTIETIDENAVRAEVLAKLGESAAAEGAPAAEGASSGGGGTANFQFYAFIPGSLGKPFTSYDYPKDLKNQTAFESMVKGISGTWLPEPGSFGISSSGPWLFETDNRGFGGGTHRVGSTGSVSAADIGSLKGKTLFKHGSSGSAHVRWETTGHVSTSNETGSITGPVKAVAPAKGSEKWEDVSPNESVVTVKGACSYPFKLAAPDIDYELVLRFKRDAAGKTTVSGEITTNVFPFYELLLNGKSVWTFSSSGTGPNVWNLNSSKTTKLPATAF